MLLMTCLPDYKAECVDENVVMTLAIVAYHAVINDCLREIHIQGFWRCPRMMMGWMMSL